MLKNYRCVDYVYALMCSKQLEILQVRKICESASSKITTRETKMKQATRKRRD